MARTGQEIYEYFGALADERTRKPADDVMSKFVVSEVEGERLSRDDIVDICYLMLIAGLDTVSDSLTCMYAFLANHPEHRRQIAQDPSCVAGAVEELLRWESPVPFGVPVSQPRTPNCPTAAGSSREPPSWSCTAPPTSTRASVRRRSMCISTVTPTATSHSEEECTVASAHTWPGEEPASHAHRVAPAHT